MITTANTHAPAKTAGLVFIQAPCPRCGKPMYKRPCPCRLNRKGWKTCAQCVKCGNIVGLAKKGAKAR